MKRGLEQNERYRRCTAFRDGIFAKETPVPADRMAPDAGPLEDALSWLCERAVSVLDFGCGNGTLLLQCRLHGTQAHLGVDLSEAGIRNAKAACAACPEGEFRFVCGGVETLRDVPSDSFDAAVLSNILDNLYPQDARAVLRETRRVLRPGGRLLVKLNPYLTEEQIRAWKISVIEGNLLDDGLLLWNNTTEEWDAILGALFDLHAYREIDYPEHDQTNRVYLLKRPARP